VAVAVVATASTFQVMVRCRQGFPPRDLDNGARPGHRYPSGARLWAR
jgi:hypothetical protein